jgi:hypothetical protein
LEICSIRSAKRVAPDQSPSRQQLALSESFAPSTTIPLLTFSIAATASRIGLNCLHQRRNLLEDSVSRTFSQSLYLLGYH